MLCITANPSSSASKSSFGRTQPGRNVRAGLLILECLDCVLTVAFSVLQYYPNPMDGPYILHRRMAQHHVL